MSGATVSHAEHGRPAWTFLRHLAEMTAAMFSGMLVFAVVTGVVAGLAGSTLEVLRLSQPELFMLGMASAMSVTMVAWMRHRGHSWRSCAEMTGAMLAPVPVVLVCYRAGAMTANPICPVSCMLMIPAMAVAMLLRPDVYTRHHPSAALA